MESSDDEDKENTSHSKPKKAESREVSSMSKTSAKGKLLESRQTTKVEESKPPSAKPPSAKPPPAKPKVLNYVTLYKMYFM